MTKGCCSKCQAKSKKKKKSEKLKEESDEETVKQKKVSEDENAKTDSQETSDLEDTKKQNTLTWQHPSTKNDKKGDGTNLLSEKNGINPPCHTARPMMYHGGRPYPSNRWPIFAAPRGHYPAFSMAPMYRPYGGGGGPFQPYQYVPRATIYNGANISPYPPMAAAIPPPYWQTRPFMDTNPMTQYTSYADNYSYCFI